MSLINEALKKAQKQRTGETEPLPAVGGESAARIARRGKPAGFTALLVRTGAGVGAVILIVVAIVLFLRRSPVETAPAKPAPVAQVPVAKPVETAPAVVAPPPVVVTPAAPAPTPVVTTAPAKIEPPKPAVEIPAPKPVVVAPPAETPRPASNKLEPRAITYIESIRVAGIRASATDSKVLMNDRVYRLGDIVEPELGLTLVGITGNSLTFQDEKGAKYTRNF